MPFKCIIPRSYYRYLRTGNNFLQVLAEHEDVKEGCRWRTQPCPNSRERVRKTLLMRPQEANPNINLKKLSAPRSCSLRGNTTDGDHSQRKTQKCA
mmetsp:Transcript_50798/g.122487  ORF Transcript_50798/g.122487 Transcript_50798/m.122487 type:complete len:96 (+) Transcript_50798:1884-2171(+)